MAQEESVGDLVARALLDSSNYDEAIVKLKEGMAGLEQQGQTGFAGIQGALGGVVSGLAQLGAAVGVIDFASSALASALAVEDLQEAITNLNGPTEETTQLLDHMKELADESPFGFEDLAKAAQSMLELGTNAETTTKSLDAITDWGAALKKTPADVHAVSEAFARLDAAGVATEKNMRALVMQGIPAWDMLAQKIGVDVVKAQELVKDGAISADLAIDAVTKSMGEKYGGAAKQFTETWDGAMNNFKEAQGDVMKTLGATIKEYLEGYVMPALNKVSELLRDFAKWWAALPGPVKDAIVILGGVLTVVTAVAGALAILAPVIEAVGVAFTGAAGPIGLAVAALIFLGKWVYDNWEPIKETLTVAWEGLSEAWTAAWEQITGWLTGKWEEIKTVATETWQSITDFLAILWNVIVGPWQAAWNLIGGFLFDSWNNTLETANT